jgi:hypothetical protein
MPSAPSTAPRKTFGVTFVCWNAGRLVEWRSEDGRLRAGRRPDHSTYWASVDAARITNPGTGKARRFHSLTSAMEAAVEHARTTAR